MKHREDIYNQISYNGRDIRELARYIALLTPEDSDILPAVINFAQRTDFGPPETHLIYLAFFMEDFSDVFEQDEFKTWPWWAKSIALMISGGCKESDEIFED